VPPWRNNPDEASLMIVSIAGSLAQAVLGAIFIVAGLSKLVGMKHFRKTLTRLGMAQALSKPAALLIIVAELVTGTALFALPASPWARLSVIILSVAFASAGAVALLSHRQIRCNCFGEIGKGVLGWPQIRLLPGLFVLATTAQVHHPQWTATQGFQIVAGIVSLLVLWQMRQERRLWTELQGDRMAVILPCNQKSTATLMPAKEDVDREVVV
jgi:uncharacterized membrane protein